MDQILTDLLVQVFMLLGILLASFTVALLKKYIGAENLKAINAELIAKQEVVDAAVLFVQQVYWAYDGPEKRELAMLRASDILNNKGLKITPEELETLLESGLKLLKKEFGEEWSKEVEGDGDEEEEDLATGE